MSESGLLSGVPTKAGTFKFTVQAENFGESSTKTYKIIVNEKPIINELKIEEGTIGKSYRAKFTITSSTKVEWLIINGSLPEGLNLNSKTGRIYGRPNDYGVFAFTVVASSDLAGYSESECNLIIHAETPEFRTSKLSRATGGAYYYNKIKLKGTEVELKITDGLLPDGIEFDASDGCLFGVPTEYGEFTFTVTASNEEDTVSKEYTLKVSQGNLSNNDKNYIEIWSDSNSDVENVNSDITDDENKNSDSDMYFSTGIITGERGEITSEMAELALDEKYIIAS